MKTELLEKLTSEEDLAIYNWLEATTLQGGVELGYQLSGFPVAAAKRAQHRQLIVGIEKRGDVHALGAALLMQDRTYHAFFPFSTSGAAPEAIALPNEVAEEELQGFQPDVIHHAAMQLCDTELLFNIPEQLKSKFGHEIAKALSQGICLRHGTAFDLGATKSQPLDLSRYPHEVEITSPRPLNGVLDLITLVEKSI